MIINNIYKNIIAILFLCGFLFADLELGFVDLDGDGSYSKSYPESTDGTIKLSVADNAGSFTLIRFYIVVDYVTNVSTAKRKESTNTSQYGRGYWRDWNVNCFTDKNNWSANNDIETSTNSLLSIDKEEDISPNTTTLRYFVTAKPQGNGQYTIALDILDDKMYEPGGDETIELYLEMESGGSLTGGANRFTYEIDDNDLEPYYGFYDNSDQSFAEGTNLDSYQNNSGTQIQPLPNPDDGVTYVQGHVDFTYTYSVSNTDAGTTSSDYNANNTTITITERYGGGTNSGTVRFDYFWQQRNLNLSIVNDNIHEPDEAFSVSLTESDPDGSLLGGYKTKNITILNDANDLPPKAYFVNASQWVDEATGNTTVDIDFKLNAASGFANPSVGYNVTGGTAEGPTDAYKDYSLTNGVVTFDGALGDRDQTVQFTLYADTYDEGADNSNTDYETIIIQLDATNVTNTRVDEALQIQHEVRIRDNDPTPLIAFSADAAVTATAGDEDAAGPPVIKVVIVDSDGNAAPSELPIKMTFENNATGTATIFNAASETTPWDYKINNATEVTLAAYAQEQAIDITINNDAFYEGNETIKFNAIAGDNVGGGTITGTFTINDDETVPKIYFTESASIITSTETGDDPLPKSIEVKLTGMTAHPVDFSYSVSSLNAGGYLTNDIDDDFDNSSSPDEAGEGSAVENTDFTLGGVTTGTILAVTSTEDTESKTTLTFTHNVDKTDELDKFVQLTVAPGGSETHATAATDGSQNQVIKLVDDDEPIQLSYSESTIDDVSEGTATTITVKKLTDSADPGPAQNNGTNKTEFTVNGIISIGDPDNAATNIDGAGDDDFNLATSGGDAIAAGATHSFSIGPDADDVSITITTIDDELYEGGTSGTDEVVLFELAMANDSNGDPQVGAVVARNTTLTYSIEDNDDKPVITFDTDNTVTSGNENTVGAPQIQIKQDRRSKFASSINYTVTPENALVVPGTGGDYILATPGVAVISALATTTTIDLNIEPDTKYENDETVTIALTSIPANVEATAGTANMSTDYVITNDDNKPKINFELSATNQLEDDGSVTLKVSLSSISGVGSTVDYAITGTATKTGDDRDFDDETTSDNAGVLSWDADVDQDQLIKITPRSDNIDEATETIIITLSNPTGGATTTGSSKLVHTINLIDSDSPPPLGFALEEDTPANNTAHEESTDLITPSVVMATGYSSDFDISIIWSIDTDNTTAVIDGVANEDFEIRDASNAALANYEGLNDAARTVTLLAGESSVNLPSFLFPKDDLYELEEVLILKIATPTSVSGLDGSGNLISANGSFITSSGGNTQDTKTITIANAPTETMPQASITTTGEGNEAETTTNFIVTLSAKNGGASKAGVDLYVDYAIGSVVSGRDAAEELTDYVLPDADGSRTVTINAYESTATKTINLLNDVIYEYDEDIVLNLVTSSGNAANQRSIVADSPNETYTYTITETDDMPIVEFADADNAIAVDEDGTAAESIVLQFKSGGTQKAEMDVHAYLSVDTDNSTALNGTDFGSSSNALAFTDNKKVTISADASTEPFDFYAKDDNRYEAEQTAIFNLSTYAANELPSGVTDISNATSAAGEKLTITINASGEDEKPVVKWVDKDEDLVNGRYPATDTDGRPVAENDGPAYFTLQLDKYSEKEIVVNYSLIESANVSASPPNIVATLGASNSYPTDFNAWGAGTDGIGSSSALTDKAGSVTFTALGNGVETNQYVNIQAVFVDDNVNEWSETIVLSIDTDGNSDVTGTGESDKIFITNDDAVPRIGFDALGSGDGDADPKEEALSNSSPSFTIELTDAAGNGTVTGKDLYFSIVTNSANNSDITVATPTSDFTAISDTEDDWIKISAATDLNAQTQSFNLVIIDDAVDEEDQKVTLTLGVKGADFNGGKSFTGTLEGFEETAADAATIVSGGGVHTFTIQDDDPEPTAYFYEENPSNTNSNAETQSVFEKYNEESVTGVKTIKVKTLGDSEKNITLYYSILTTGCVSAGGCATAGHDYTAIDDNTVLSILPSDNNEKTFSVSTLDDDRDEFAQDIIIQLSSNSESNATVGSSDANPGKYFLIIEDKDPEPEVDFKLATRDQPENVPNGKSTIELSRHTEKNVVIGYETSSNEADFGIFVVNDLDDNNGSVTWPEDIDMTFEKTTISINGLAGDVANGDPMKAEIPTVLGTDTNDEWDEKFKIQIDAETSENVDKGSTNPETIITIQDDDAPAIVMFTVNPAASSNTEPATPTSYDIAFKTSGDVKSGKDIVIKYSITREDNPNDKDHATKNIDYNFGSVTTVTTDTGLDTIKTIRSGGTTENISLTIINDDIYEEDQLIKIKISLANSYPDDATNGYYNSLATSAGVEAIIDTDRDLFTYTIENDEADPIVHFSSDVSVAEGGEDETALIPLSLKDAGGNLVASEKSVSVPYVLDTDNSTASKDVSVPAAYSKYEDDFNFTDATLTFSPITYTYNSASDSYSSNPGENPKSISLDIYGDDLYELDESITINLTEAGFESAATTGGDHSFTYTLEN